MSKTTNSSRDEARQRSADVNENENLDAWLAARTPEELDALRDYAWERLLQSRKVKVDGKQMSLKALAEEIAKEKDSFERGLYQEDQRTISRAEAQKLVPSFQLRRGSFKQILRKDEEEKLELQRLGHGNCFAHRKAFGIIPFIPNRNFAYGIFARPNMVEKVMGETWSGQDPENVLDQDYFYLDAIRRCHQMEMTAMMVISRPLPLKVVQREVQVALLDSMQTLKGDGDISKEESGSLQSFVRLLDENRLARSGWVRDGSIEKGTHIILTATPKGWLSVEAITPGTIGQRKTSYVGICQNPVVTAAAFHVFLGRKSFDKVGRRDVGSGLLWAANGLPFDVDPNDPTSKVGFADEHGRMQLPINSSEEHLPLTLSIFRMLTRSESPAPMLLDSITKIRHYS